MGKPKIDVVKLNRLLRSGKSVKQCAEHFGVSPSAVSQRKKELNISVVKNIVLESAHRVVDKNLNAVDQLNKINQQANTLLDELEHKPELKLKIMAEIRGQLKLQLEIFQSLYDMRMVQEFQAEVLSTIAEASTEVRDDIIRRLQEKRAFRSAVKIS